ncbi:MAG: hypothetical protein K2I36_00835 [Ureaplasma sp.]|nr:hypothetical protein [Ureaplasma sp.]MDE7221661.1 hypothetical protein [Ureaplasma sp.]
MSNNSNKQNLSDYVASSLNQKLNIKDRVDVDKNNDDQKDENNKIKNKKTLKERWNKQKIDKKYVDESRNWKDIYKRAIFGSLIGGNSIVYGSSSSLYAYQMKNYYNIVEGWCDFFSPKSLRDWLWKFVWILPFMLTFLVAIIIIYAINSVAFANGYELSLIFLFMAINIIGLFLLILNPTKRPKNFFKKNEIDWKQIILFVTSMIIIFGISFAAKYAWIQEYPFGHLTYEQINTIDNNIIVSEIIRNNSIQTTYAIQILIAGFLAGLTTFIPGTSGTFMLTVIGSNSFINTATRFVFGGYTGEVSGISLSWAWSTIIIALFGIILGFVSSAFGTKYLMNKFENSYKTINLGFSIILVISILVSLQNIDYSVIGSTNGLLISCLILLLVPIAIGCGLLWWFKKDELFSIVNSFKSKEI